MSGWFDLNVFLLSRLVNAFADFLTYFLPFEGCQADMSISFIRRFFRISLLTTFLKVVRLSWPHKWFHWYLDWLTPERDVDPDLTSAGLPFGSSAASLFYPWKNAKNMNSKRHWTWTIGTPKYTRNRMTILYSAAFIIRTLWRKSGDRPGRMLCRSRTLFEKGHRTTTLRFRCCPTIHGNTGSRFRHKTLEHWKTGHDVINYTCIFVDFAFSSGWQLQLFVAALPS